MYDGPSDERPGVRTRHPVPAGRGASMSVFQDLRFALRLLIKDRWFTVIAALALALGMAANNAVFTFVNGVLLRGIPFRDGERIMALGTRDTRNNRNLGVSFLDFEDWRAS